MNRRTLLCGTALLATTATAGCQEEISDVLLDEDDFEATAEPAAVADGTLDELGYTHLETEQYRVEEDLEIAGERRALEAGNWVATYLPDEASGAAEDGEFPAELEEDGGALGILTTPDFTIAGQTINPVEYFDDEELIEAVDDEFASISISDVERVGDTAATILGEEAEVGIFDVQMEADDESHEGSAYLARVEHEGDTVVPVGTHVDGVEARDELLQLMENVIHPA